jgi:hypothetical protein
MISDNPLISKDLYLSDISHIFDFHLERFNHLFISILSIIEYYIHLKREDQYGIFHFDDLYIKLFIDGGYIYLYFIYFENTLIINDN